jgi:hypothetical protein
MTPEDAFGRQPASADCAMLFDREFGIFGTTWIEAATIAGQWTDRKLVQANQC